jgi:fructuronate reductase
VTEPLPRLGLAALADLPPAIGRPPFAPERLPVGIVHLGLGNFQRAHAACYTQDALAAVPGPWGICGVSLRSPSMRDRLVPQDGLYTMIERGPGQERLTVVGSVREVLFAPDDPTGVVRRLAEPATTVVTLTITEKGYCHDPGTGALDRDHPEIRHDLEHPEAPRSAIGLLAAGLERRRTARAGPLTIVCCDNLPQNGHTLRGILLAFAALRDEALAAWIERTIPFPSTMVDRIVPATTPADIAAVARRLGVEDAAPVGCEPFRQWVIEDRFAAPRPAWERAGAELVAEVAPFEEMKLRLLNGAHSALAYPAVAAGVEYVADAVAMPGMARYLQALWSESGSTLHLPAGYDLAGYVDALGRRFANPALGHRTAQIAMDGSQKLPQRLLAPVRERLARDQPVAALALAVAAWMRHVRGRAEDGRAIALTDPLAPRLAAIAAGAADAEALASGLLAVREVFGQDLPADRRFTAPVGTGLRALLVRGTRAVLAEPALFSPPV